MYQVTQNEGFLNLSLNENYLSFGNQGVLKLENLNHYPDISTYQHIEGEASKLYGSDAENILLTNGSDDGIFLIQQWFSKMGGGSIVITNPTFSMYENYANNLGMCVIKQPLNKNLEVELETLIETIGQNPNSLVFLPNPNSPTGTMLSPEDIQRLLNTQATIVIDEAYIEFSGKPSAISLLKTNPNLIVLRTLSKFYGLAGVRIGFIIAKCVSDIKKFQAPFSISVINAEVALSCLRYINQNQKVIQKFQNDFLEMRKCFLEKISKKNNIVKIYNTDANFFLMEVRNIQIILNNFQKNKLLVKDFSQILPNTIRFCLADSITNAKILECL